MLQRIVLLFILLGFYCFTMGQSFNIAKPAADGFLSKSIRFDKSNPYKFISERKTLMDVSGIPDNTDFISKNQYTSEGGVTYRKISQTLLQHQVLGNELILVIENGNVNRIRGKWFSEMPIFSSDITISQNNAIEFAASYLGFDAQQLLDNGFNRDPFKKMIYVPRSLNSREPNYALTYEVELITSSSLRGYRLYISAQNGEVILSEPLNLECNIPIQGETANGPVQFVHFHGDDDQNNGELRLFACEAEANIHTRSAPLFAQSIEAFYDQSEEIRAPINGFNPTNLNFNSEGVDVHWAFTETVSYFNQEFGLTSYNDEGADVNVFINFVNLESPNSINASYSTALDAFLFTGFENIRNYAYPEVSAHEFVHGITNHFGGLIYAGESGAISEAWSDILSVDVESHLEDNAYEWHIGDDIPLFLGRSMSDPNSTMHPACYKKPPFWVETENCTPSVTNDFCGVHTNSSIGNKWFHILTDGDEGSNGCGESYNVTGIGIEKSKHIAYNAIFEMTALINYEDIRDITIEYTAEEYGFCSPEYIACVDAWHAVCVGEKFSEDPPENLSVIDLTPCSVTLTWDLTGAQAYIVCIRKQDGSLTNCFLAFGQDNTMTFPNLEPGCTFETQIVSNCNGNESVPNVGESFTIPEECPVVNQVQVLETTVCSATIAWEELEYGSYLVELFEQGNPVPIEVQQTQNSNFCFTDLEPGTAYTFQIRRDCVCERSEASDPVNFVTLPCEQPDDPMIRFDECGYEYFIPQGLIMELRRPSGTISLRGPFSDDRWQFVGSDGSTIEIDFTLIKSCEGKNCVIEVRSNTVTGITPDIQNNDCLPPSNLEFITDVPLINILNPAENTTGYEYQIKSTIDGDFGPIQTSGNGSSLHSGIFADCFLEIRVRSVCECTDPPSFSNWENFIFEPEFFCEPPEAEFNDVDLCQGSVLLSADSGACIEEYHFRIREASGGQWEEIISNNTVQVFDGLKSCTTYDWQMRTKCQNLDVEEWDQYVSQVYQSPCCLPVNSNLIAIENDCPDFYMISWQQPQIPPDFYEIEIKSSSDQNWDNALNFSLAVEYLELVLPDDCIDFRIRTACGDDQTCPWYSEWSEINFCIDCCNVTPGMDLNSAGCALEVSNTGTGDIDWIEWDLGDGTIIEGETLIHNYNAIGTYEVCATYFCTNGTMEKYCEMVQVSFCCTDRDVSFESMTGMCDMAFTPILEGGTANSYLWNFGDNTTSTEEAPSHTYQVSGQYEVCLRVVFDNFCTEISCQTFDVISCCEETPIDFTISSNSCSITFEPSIMSGEPISYFWLFGDGTGSIEMMPDHSYFQPGTYQVCLEVEFDSGCINNFCKDIEVELCCENNNVDFLQSTTSCTVSFITITSSGGIAHNWDFGDGNTDTGNSGISHTYEQDGSYKVSLEVEFEDGCVVVHCENVDIESCSENIDISFDTSNDQCDIQFTPSVTGGVPTGYNWDFGDGTTSAEEQPSYSYSVSGEYNVCLTVTFDDGSELSSCNSVQAIFCCEATNVSFNHFIGSCGVSFSPNVDGMGQTYLWDFGDGNTSTDFNTSHNYSMDGIYEVCFEVTFNSDCVKEDCKMVNLTTCCADKSIAIVVEEGECCWQLTAEVTGGTPVQYIWYNGEIGGSSIEWSTQYPTIMVLDVIFENGCRLSTNSLVPGCFPEITISGNCTKTYNFSGLIPGATSWFWEFGDGNTAEGETVEYEHAESGNYEICLTVTNEEGCFHNICEFHDIECCDFTPLATALCEIDDDNRVRIEWEDRNVDEYEVEITLNAGACCDGPEGITYFHRIQRNFAFVGFPQSECFGWRVRAKCGDDYGDWTTINCAGLDYCTSINSLCGDGVQNGNETGIDCGGGSCQPCECDEDVTLVADFYQDQTIRAPRYINTGDRVIIGRDRAVNLFAGSFIELGIEFEIERGADVLIEIEDCRERD